MNIKRLIVLFLVVVFSFAAGGLSASLYYKYKLVAYEKLTSAIARWDDSDTTLKEAELLIALQKRYLATDKSAGEATCFLVKSKINRMSKDLIVIQEGWHDSSRENDTNFVWVSKWFSGTAKSRFELLVKSSQELGC
ncbi:hypothetical protein [Methylotenera sp.]|uniref:hypothetical protein n=1 Tax=Methylotenera sp. TaxID=2051956 RepID=UPI00248975C0|nr:hypothetical protein [Methylotenera sp.]MDI1298508.1 hypothetical protein [Methylotenera sp.]